MRKLWFLAVAVCVVALPARVDAQQGATEGVFFQDSFDTYVTGSTIAGQGGWETWDNNPAADTTVVSTQSFNPPNSLLITLGPAPNPPGADIVHQFAGLTSGVWHARVMVYIPSTQTGEAFFILMNTYVPGVHNLPDWSAQVVFCQSGCLGNGIPGTVFSLGGGEVGGGGNIPMVTDAWVEIRAMIDLDNNMYQLFYGGQLFETQQWTLTNPVRLQAMDLFSNASSESYMDLAWVDTTAPVSLQMFSVE
jgi:hypothetical protein